MNIIHTIKRFLTKHSQLELFMINKNCKEINFNIDDDYHYRNCNEADFFQILKLMKKNEFNLFKDNDNLIKEMSSSVPYGNFVVEHKLTKKIVGIFMARHNDDGIHINSGRLDWLVVDPLHRGKSLGYILTALTVNCLIKHGYKIIFVGTNDSMIPAIKTYLNIGFKPNLFNSEMSSRWKKIYKILNLNFDKQKYLDKKNKYKIKNYL